MNTYQQGPPDGDYDNYIWVPGMGWVFVGNEEDGTAGMSSRINKQTGQREFYEPVDTFQRDGVWWDLKRPLQFGEEAWLAGGDLFATQEGWRYSKDNPYVYTDEMKARDQQAALEHEQQFYYDPETDTTYIGGYGSSMTMKGQIPSISREDMSYEDQRWYDNDRYYEGHHQLSEEGKKAFRELGGTYTGFGNVFHQDVTPLLDAFAGDEFNPFYGAISQAMIDRSRELGHIGKKLTRFETRADNNIMDYLYREFSTPDQFKNRREVFNRWNEYMKKRDMNADDFYNRHMTEAAFKEMGLDEFKDFNADFNPRGSMANPFADRGLGGTNASEGGGFLDSYRKRSTELNARPSVASLFNEMKDF